MLSSSAFTPAPSRQNFDVIIIGVGLSGLTARAFLSKAGAHVLVCEQAAKIEGLYNSFEIGGFHFDGGIKAVENNFPIPFFDLPEIGHQVCLE